MLFCLFSRKDIISHNGQCPGDNALGSNQFIVNTVYQMQVIKALCICIYTIVLLKFLLILKKGMERDLIHLFLFSGDTSLCSFSFSSEPFIDFNMHTGHHCHVPCIDVENRTYIYKFAFQGDFLLRLIRSSIGALASWESSPSLCQFPVLAEVL